MSNIIRDGLQAQNDTPRPQGFTYDEGSGVKDTIVMSGPLGEVYTKALNTYFQKQDLTNPESKADTGENQADNVDKKLKEDADKNSGTTAAMETQQLDQSGFDFIHNELDQENVDKRIGTGLKFARGSSPDVPLDDVSTTAFIMDMQQALQPEVVEQIQSSKSNGRYHTVLVVYAKNHGYTIGQTLERQTITIGEGNGSVQASRDITDFMAAAEEIYVKNGIPVFQGVGKFLVDYQKRNY